MNTTPEQSLIPRLQAFGEQIFGPVRAPRGTGRRRLLTARSVVAYVGLIATLVQVVVWLTIGVLSGHLDAPWWLWTTVPAAVAVVVLTGVDRWSARWASAATRPTPRKGI